MNWPLLRKIVFWITIAVFGGILSKAGEDIYDVVRGFSKPYIGDITYRIWNALHDLENYKLIISSNLIVILYIYIFSRIEIKFKFDNKLSKRQILLDRWPDIVYFSCLLQISTVLIFGLYIYNDEKYILSWAKDYFHIVCFVLFTFVLEAYKNSWNRVSTNHMFENTIDVLSKTHEVLKGTTNLLSDELSKESNKQ